MTIDPQDFDYCSDFMDEFPHNSILNKVVTGCGMTTLALLPKTGKYIVCVPFRNLVKNKMKWCKEKGIECVGVFKRKSIETYLYGEDPKDFDCDKIITTWDSLPKVIANINPTEYKLLVDESHKLLDSGSFRRKAIKYVLNSLYSFKSFCLGTATPVKQEYQLPQLKNLPIVTIQWPTHKLKEVHVKVLKLEKNLLDTIALLCTQHLSGEKTTNAHIFINSVKNIVSICKKIKSNDIRVVAADTTENQEYVTALIKDLKIDDINSPIKKINFYTSTAFEGVDIYDDNASMYVVTDGNKDHTKINIMTTMPQIVGRIRNDNSSTIHLIYTVSQYSGFLSEQDYSQYIKEQLNKAATTINVFQTLDEFSKELMLKGAITNDFFLTEDGVLEINDTAWHNEMHNYTTYHQTYYKLNKLSNTVVNSIPYSYTEESLDLDLTPINKLKINKQPNFQELLKQYLELKTNDPINPMIREIEIKKPLIKDALLLGEEKLKALKYQARPIKAELEKLIVFKSISHNIVHSLKLKTNDWISLEELKLKLTSIYKELQINKTAKATDIQEWYGVKSKSKRIDSKVIGGYLIITPKIIIN